MQLVSSIVIRRPPEQVWNYLSELSNIQDWDRGVGSSKAIAGTPGVGFEFETLGHSGAARMAYRIVETGSDSCTVELTSSTGNARFFKRALWRFSIQPAPEGSLLTCCAEFTVKLRYGFMAPLLWLKRSAIQMDLEQLRQAVETT